MATWIVFVAGAVIAVAGAVGLVVVRNPVHSALLLVLTLVGVAILFVTMEAHFLAAVQIIVYAGAVVVLFLFVIMLLGVDMAEDVRVDPIAGQRSTAIAMGIASFGLLVMILAIKVDGSVGTPPPEAAFDGSNVERLSNAVFTKYLYPFEITSLLLVIAVVGAVLLSRKPVALGPDPVLTASTSGAVASGANT
jgi:NADH-quinone oxidoreductase subunit J